jgi:hypothetical protein
MGFLLLLIVERIMLLVVLSLFTKLIKEQEKKAAPVTATPTEIDSGKHNNLIISKRDNRRYQKRARVRRSCVKAKATTKRSGEEEEKKIVVEKEKYKSAEAAFVKITPVYPHCPIVVDPLFFEGRGSNSRGILGRLVMRNRRGVICSVGAVRSLWMLRKWPFLIRFFSTAKIGEAFQIWNVLVTVTMYLSWQL